MADVDFRSALADLVAEFKRVFPIYYYDEPWAHDKNTVLLNAQLLLSLPSASQPMSREGMSQAAQERLTDAQVECLYRNLPPSQQQDARSLAAFKRVVHLIENVHRIGIGSGSGSGASHD